MAFEHFWENPNEPQHSGLLGYFIDPKADHGCGAFLLRKFLDEFAESGCSFPDYLSSLDECIVHVEKKRMDLSIRCDRPQAKFAVIIENKINGAVNQDRQLENYVERMHEEGFAYSDIYVLYLPLDGSKLPEPSDLDAILRKGAQYRHVTYEHHILRWLDAVLGAKAQSDWPSAMFLGMQDNLAHYRNLIRYLVKRRKQLAMKDAILQQLKLAESSSDAPTLSEVKALAEATSMLQKCIEQVHRGKLLFNVYTILDGRGYKPSFYSAKGSNVTIVSPFDPQFEREQNVGIQASDSVVVCIGGHSGDSPETTFWTGYLRIGTPDQQSNADPIVKAEIERRFQNQNDLDTNKPWYAWYWERSLTYENCSDQAVALRVAETLIEMLDGLRTKLPK